MATPAPAGYRSATEYHFREEQSDAIIRTTTYHCEDYYQSVISFLPHEHDRVRLSIATTFQRSPAMGLGSLGRLPLELLYGILLDLDLYSVFKFRQTNVRSRQTVDSLHPYRMVALHGLDLLCALLRTRLATDTSLFGCYSALCTETCVFCGDFGGFINLLTWSRCCFKCLHAAPECRVITREAAQRYFNLDEGEVKQLRSCMSLLGRYALQRHKHAIPRRATLVSAHQARLIFEQQPHPPARVHPVNIGPGLSLNFLASCALPYYDRRTGRVEPGMSCEGCRLAFKRCIIGKSSEEWAAKARNKVYVRDGFLKHFRWCEHAQLLWTSSGEGSQQPAISPVTEDC